MRVRKPTSKRASTRMKEGIKKKSNAHQRKLRKKSKTDVTWRSKNKKDPGIPSSFPYKDRIVQEIEDTKRRDQEEKLRRKLEKKAAYLLEDADAMSEDDDEEENDGSNGLAALLASAQASAKDYDGEDDDEDAMSEEEEHEVVDYEIEYSEDEDEDNSELDKSRKSYDKIFKTVVEASDVILYVLDARDPEGTRSRKVEEAVLQSQGKRLILILNKVDLIPQNVLTQWLDFLKSAFPTIPLKSSVSGSNGSANYNKKLTQQVTSKALLEALKSYANKSNLKRSIIVGVIGYPNVGKSSIINSLTSRFGGNKIVCPVGNQAGVTTSMREVKIDNKLKLLDSPGIVFPASSSRLAKKHQHAQLSLLNALPPNSIHDPIPAITLLVKRLAKSTEMSDNFKKYYSLPAIPSSNLDEFVKQLLIHVARRLGRIGKKGIPNLESAGEAILNDWRAGRITGWTLPKSSIEDDEHKAKIPNGATGAAPPPTVLQTTIVAQWSKEFDLDGLLNGDFGGDDE